MNPSEIESWRQSMNFPRLSSENLEILSGNERIRRFLVHMTRRALPLAKKTYAERALTWKVLSDEKCCEGKEEARIMKRIMNARKRQSAEAKVHKKYGEISSSEVQNRDFVVRIKNLSEKIQALLQILEEKKKKEDVVQLYSRELLRSHKDLDCLLTSLRGAIKILERKRGIKGDLLLFRQKELKNAVAVLLSMVAIHLDHLEQYRMCNSSQNTLNLVVKSKKELVSHFSNELGYFPWRFILQHVMSLQDERNVKISSLAADWIRFEREEFNVESEDSDIDLDIPFNMMNMNGKENTRDTPFQIMKQKLEAVRSQRQEADTEIKELLGGVDHEMQFVSEKIISTMDHIAHYPKKLLDLHRRGLELGIPYEALSQSIQNLQHSIPRELKLFTGIPLICIEKMNLNYEKTYSYLSLSHFLRIPQDLINISWWTTVYSPHILIEKLFLQVQYVTWVQQTLRTMQENRSCVAVEFTEVPKRKKIESRELCHMTKTFADELQQSEILFYNLQQVHKFFWEHCHASWIPQKLTVCGKSADEWLTVMKSLFEESNFNLH